MELEEFSNWLFTEGKAAKTIESYVNDVKGFQCYLQEKLKDIQVLSRFSFVRYKEHLAKEHYTVATINKKINLFFSFREFEYYGGMFINQFESLLHFKLYRCLYYS